MQLTLRREKGSPLTHDEVDDNFAHLAALIADVMTPQQIQALVDNAVSADNIRDDEAYEEGVLYNTLPQA